MGGFKIMKRETGYYWVKKHPTCKWETSFWNDRNNLWLTLSASFKPIAINDEGWSEINETRILNPDEIK